MVKLRVWNESDCDEVVRVALREDKGDIEIRVVNEDGSPKHGGVLLIISDDGRVYRPLGINEQLGFYLDHLGRIKLVDE